MAAPKAIKRTKAPATHAPRPPKAVPARARVPKPAPEAAVRERYWEAVGRRKTAVARVRIYGRGGETLVNGKPIGSYFAYAPYGRTAHEALNLMNVGDHMRMTVRVSGGGIHAQAEAVRHGAARALALFNPEFRKRLKRAGFLTRDPRMKERKKFGLKGARRAPQWQKR